MDSPSGRSLLKYFHDELGTIEILGKSNRVERVYFKIDTVKKEHWRTRHLQVGLVLHAALVTRAAAKQG